MTTDPIERARLFLDEAAREFDALRHKLGTANAEMHQMRRRTTRAETALQEAEQLNQQLKRQIERLEDHAEKSRRAMLDHAART